MKNPFRNLVELASGGTKTEKALPVTDEKAVVRSKGDLFSSFGIEFKAEGDLDFTDYREMMGDAQVRAAVMFKILARISSGWDIKPASDDPKHVEHAEFITDQLENMNGTVSGFLRRAMLAMAYGQTIHEIVINDIAESGKWKGKYTLNSLKWKRPENFRAVTDDFGNLEKIQQKDGDNWDDAKDLDPLYFVFWAWDHEGDFKGKSDLDPAYRYVKAKELIDWVWNVYLEKYATPTPVGKFPPGTKDPEKQQILGFMSNLHTKKALAMPNNWKIELLESERTGGDYEAKCKYCDRMISLTMLLPSLMMGEGESGAYALGKQHGDNFTWVLDALGEEVAEEVMLEQIIKPMIDWNFSDIENYPKFAWRSFDVVDLKVMAEAMKILKEADILHPGESWIRDRLDIPAYVAEDGDNEALPPVRKSPVANEDEEGDKDPDDSIELRSGASKKHNAKEIAARMDKLEDAAIKDTTTALDAMFSGLKMDLRKRKIMEKKDFKAARALKLRGIGPVRAALERGFGDSLHWGTSDGLGEVKRGLAVTGKSLGDLPDSMGINLKSMNHEPWEDIPESVLLSSAEIISFWEGKVPIQKALMTQYSRESFTMAGAFNDDLLSGSQRIIEKGLRRGASYAQVEQELASFWKPYLEIDGAIDPGIANAYRIETIVRTTMAEAYNTGRMNLYQHPEVRDMIVAFEYSAVMDRRTTPFCAEWDGKILAASDPRVDQNNPPNHYRCRSVWIPITRGEQFTLTETPPAVTPATGFKY